MPASGTVTVAHDLGRGAFLEALDAFSAEAESADWAMLYFAGHGIEIGGINYLTRLRLRPTRHVGLRLRSRVHDELW
jgi:hypothetical protein